MRSLLAIVGLSFWMSYVLVCPANGIDINILNSDFVYFPDQAEYLKLSIKCPENMILWPGTRRCYREGEQGPCNIALATGTAISIAAYPFDLLHPARADSTSFGYIKLDEADENTDGEWVKIVLHGNSDTLRVPGNYYRLTEIRQKCFEKFSKHQNIENLNTLETTQFLSLKTFLDVIKNISVPSLSWMTHSLCIDQVEQFQSAPGDYYDCPKPFRVLHFSFVFSAQLRHGDTKNEILYQPKIKTNERHFAGRKKRSPNTHQLTIIAKFKSTLFRRIMALYFNDIPFNPFLKFLSQLSITTRHA
ncbi:hypothetical protein WN51_02540 [Melipona quadrifasciata]|uniref:Uncharacterized protein n=1 Tax=Melipona quadrifasciata TaxID=166423 RepID=A0A0N0BDI3_9HYME|nr:hypothetical protein WN51_02540 [Melipona quadrifasciata]